MAADTQHSHRPGALKQQNKSHKHGKHRSKGQLDRDVKGIQCTTVYIAVLCSIQVGETIF